MSDYELLNQNTHGLGVIQKTKMSRSILVTSHYADKNVQKAAVHIGTKILPKQLASDVPIQIHRAIRAGDSGMRNSDRVKMDVIFVDDEQYLLDTFK